MTALWAWVPRVKALSMSLGPGLKVRPTPTTSPSTHEQKAPSKLLDWAGAHLKGMPPLVLSTTLDLSIWLCPEIPATTASSSSWAVAALAPSTWTATSVYVGEFGSLP